MDYLTSKFLCSESIKALDEDNKEQLAKEMFLSSDGFMPMRTQCLSTSVTTLLAI